MDANMQRTWQSIVCSILYSSKRWIDESGSRDPWIIYDLIIAAVFVRAEALVSLSSCWFNDSALDQPLSPLLHAWLCTRTSSNIHQKLHSALSELDAWSRVKASFVVRIRYFCAWLSLNDSINYAEYLTAAAGRCSFTAWCRPSRVCSW